MATDYEKLAAAARKAVAKKEVPLADGVKVTIRELLKPERNALNARLYICGDDGKPLTHDKDRQLDPKGDTWLYQEGIHAAEEWIAATIEPPVTVEQLMSDDWPESLKDRLFDTALTVNGLDLKGAAKN